MTSTLLRRPWLVRHAIVLILLISFVNLGLWQLRRLHSRRLNNAKITARTAVPEQPFLNVVLAPNADADSLAYRRVTIQGVFDTAHEVILPDRSYNERAGNELVTPMKLASGLAVIVDRGWVPLNDDNPPIVEAAPPVGTVTVSGVLFPSQQRGRFGPKIPPTGDLNVLYRIDLPRYQKQLPYKIYPVYAQEESQAPPQPGQYPIVEALPKPDEGPHLSYAFQWFSFALIAIVGYTALLRKQLR